RGKSNSSIADIIGISPHTVNGYLRSVYLKTGVSDRTSAALVGVRTALIQV
ncbi:MAG: DNA-binding response regulator, partial [Acidimicrobiales bacterium]